MNFEMIETTAGPLPRAQFLIGGRWRNGSGELTYEIVDPAKGSVIQAYTSPSPADLDEILHSSAGAFPAWRATPARERGAILRRAGAMLRERIDLIARVMTTEQGKPLQEACAEILGTAEMFDWCAEQAVREYGRVVPARMSDVRHLVVREPVGPVAAFAAWNFPARNPGVKIAAALAAGCTCIIKPAEETPMTCILLAQALLDAGLPQGVLNLVYGDPAAISTHLIASSVVRKVSLTGSTRVGKIIAGLAAQSVKKITLELGGHAPVIVFDDADLEHAVRQTLAAKFRNAGQQCIAPTRFFVQQKSYQEFVARFTEAAALIKVGDGRDPATQMGPLINQKRRREIDSMVADAEALDATAHVSRARVFGPESCFLSPTVLSDVPDCARIMSQEPFGPVAAISPFSTMEEVVARANALPYGLAAYAFTSSLRTATRVGDALEAGMVGINTCKVSAAELPFGGVKDSGYGYEGGDEALDAYTVSKSISTMY